MPGYQFKDPRHAQLFEAVQAAQEAPQESGDTTVDGHTFPNARWARLFRDAKAAPDQRFALDSLGFGGLTQEDVAALEQRAGRSLGIRDVSVGLADIPFAGPFFGIKDAKEGLQAEARVRGGRASREEQLRVLQSAVDAGRERGTGNYIGEGLKSSATMGLEIGAGLLVGGVGAAGVAAARKAAVSEGALLFTKLATATGVAVAGPELAPRLLGSDGGRWRLESLQRAMPELAKDLTPEQWQQLEGLADTTFPEWLKKRAPLWKGAVSQTIEVLSEFSGGLLGKIPLIAGARALQARMLARILRTTPGGVEAAFGRLARGVAIDDVFSEWLEERVSAAGKAAIPGLEETWADVIPGWKQSVAEFAVAAIPGLGMATASALRERIVEGLGQRKKAEAGGQGANSAGQGANSAAASPDILGAPGETAAPNVRSQTAEQTDTAAEPLPSEQPQPQPEEGAGEIQGALSARPLGRDAGTQANIGRGLSGTLQATTERRTNPVRIMDALAGVVEAAGGKTPIRSGRVRMKWAAGHFDVRQETIELLRSNDIDVATHEVAHAIEKHIFGRDRNPWDVGGTAGIDATAQRELQALGRALYGNQKPAGGYRREGWSEYLRLWAMQGGAQNTPALDAWFNQQFLPAHPEVASKLETVRDLATVWRTQGSVGRGREMIVQPPTTSERLVKLRDAVAGGKLTAAVYDRMVDMFGPYKRLAADASEAAERELTTKEDPFKQASALRYTAPARARYMAEHGMLDIAGNVVGPPLAAVRQYVKGRYDDFLIYLYGRRAEALWEDPQAVDPKTGKQRGRDPGISIQDAKQIISELGSTEFEKAADLVYQWAQGVLDYMAQSSPTMAEYVRRIRDRDPGAYVPLRREFDELARALGGGRGAVRTGTVTQRLKGSGRRIKDPLVSLLAQAQSSISRAHERRILESIVGVSKIEGMGHLVEKVPVDKVPVAERSLEMILDELEGRGLKALQAQTGIIANSLPGADALRTELAALGVDLADPMTFFEQSLKPTKKGETPVISVVDKGKIHYYRIGDPALYKALEGLDVWHMPRALDILFGWPKRILTATVTSVAPGFALYANPARDVQTYAVNTSQANPALAALGWGSMMLKSGGHAVTLGHYRPQEIDLMERLGVQMSRILAEDRANTRRAARRLAGHRVLDLGTVGDAFDVFRDVLQFSENAPRAAEMMAVAKRIGWEPGQPMTYEQSIEIGIAGRGVTVDFAAAGSWGRIANQFIPFFNAAIQGPRAFGKALQRDPLGTSLRAIVSFTVPTVAMWLMHKDDDWYQDMTDEERYGYYYFQVGNELLRVPRAHEIGMVFSTIPEMLLNRWHQDDPEGAVEWAKSLTGFAGDSLKEAYRVMAPDVVPVLPGLVAEQMMNKRFFQGTPIVTRALEQRPTDEQFDDYTSRAAIKVGELTGLSPVRVQHTIEYLTGTVGRETLKLFGRGADDVDPEQEAADTMILGRAWRRGGTAGTRSRHVQELYDLAHEMNVRSKSLRSPETVEQRQERALLGDAVKAITALAHIRAVTQAKDQRRELTLEQTRIAKDALEAASSGNALRERWRFRREAGIREAQETAAENQLRAKRQAAATN